MRIRLFEQTKQDAILDWLKSDISIVGDIENTNGLVTITSELKDSDDYGRVYSLIENNPGLTIDSQASVIDHTTSSLLYNHGEDYEVFLLADFDKDYYVMSIQYEEDVE